MKPTSTEPLDASKQFCPNETCSARGKVGESKISEVNSYGPWCDSRSDGAMVYPRATMVNKTASNSNGLIWKAHTPRGGELTSRAS